MRTGELQKNVTDIIKLCNFKKLGTNHGTYVTNAPEGRLIYLTDETYVELDCPDGKLRSYLKGLHIVPSQCHVKCEKLEWPAYQTTEIDIKHLLEQGMLVMCKVMLTLELSPEYESQ